MKKQNGFTFIEMLAAMLILGFLILLVGSGTNAAMKVYDESISYSESNTLCSTLIFSIENELRYASSFNTDTDGVINSFTSADYGMDTSFKVDDGKLKISSSTNTFPVVGDKTYTDGLEVYKFQIKKGDKVSAGQMIEINITLNNGTSVSTEVLNLNS
jgi:prepilin-type N-terminal cleavage/methylation domain-containing protein